MQKVGGFELHVQHSTVPPGRAGFQLPNNDKWPPTQQVIITTVCNKPDKVACPTSVAESLDEKHSTATTIVAVLTHKRAHEARPE